jgi:hypothetical protein
MLINNRRNYPSDVSKILGTMLKEFLGTYTYDNGQTRVAINIGKAIHNAKVTGLEMVIPKMPMIRDSQEIWNVYVIDRGTNPDALYDLFLVLKTQVRVFDAVAYMPQNVELGSYDQVMMSVSGGWINYIANQLGLYDPGTDLNGDTCQLNIPCN